MESFMEGDADAGGNGDAGNVDGDGADGDHSHC